MFFLSCFIAILFVIGLIPNLVYAGYDEKSNISSEPKTIFKNVSQYMNVSDINDIDKQTILLLPFEELENINFERIKDIMSKQNINVLIEYTTFEELLEKNINIDLQSISEMLIEDKEFIKKYDNNGYMSLRLDDDNQLYSGGFYTKAQDFDMLLKYYNMFKGNIDIEVDKDSIVTKETVTPKSTPGNYELRFYWSSSTSDNKVYQSASTSSSILVNLYRSEMLQNLGTEHSRTYNDSYGGTYYENFVKVQANNSSGSLSTGYFLKHRTYNPNNGDEGWGGDDMWYNYCKTLKDLLQSAYNSNYQSARTGGHVFYRNGYYGVRIKTGTSRYNSSGSYIGNAPVNSVAWVNGSNKCGYGHPEYMTLHAYSSTSSNTMTSYSSTTFIDAGLLVANPVSYKIGVRWW